MSGTEPKRATPCTGAIGPGRVASLACLSLIAGLVAAPAALAQDSMDAGAAATGLGLFEVSGFDPRYHDDPSRWLGDLGLFGIPGSGAQPFTTGAVGLNHAFDPRDMAAGVKLEGQAGDWTVNVLGVQEQDEITTDLRNSFVARITRQFFDAYRLGFIVTSGDPDTGEAARTVGMDVQFQGQGPLRGQAWVQRTDNAGETGDDGAWGLQLHYPDGPHVVDARFEHYGDDFDPALGAVSRPGIDDARFQYRFQHADAGRPGMSDGWRLAHAVTARDTRAIDSDEASGQLRLSLLQAETPSGDRLEGFVSAHREVLIDGFDLVDRLAVGPGQYDYRRYGLDYRTDRIEDWTLGLRLATGDYLRGERDDWQVSGEWRAAEWLRLNAEYAISDHRQPTGDFTARTLSLKSELTLMPGWSLAPAVQFNNVNEQLGLKARLHWRTGPGQDLFLIWNRTVLRNLEDRLVAPLQDSVLRGIWKLRFD